MVSAPTFAAMWFTLFICFGFPVLLWVLCALREPRETRPGVSVAVGLGAAGFLVTQVLLRIPLLQALSLQPWFASFAASHPVLYTLALALTAALFETGGRWAVLALLHRSGIGCRRAMAAGVGHGGFEAIYLVGLTYINNLFFSFAINSGGFSAMMGNAGVPASTAKFVYDSLVSGPVHLFAIAGVERVCAILFHMAMTVLLAWTMVRGKTLLGLGLCLGFHTLTDFVGPGLLAQYLGYEAFYAFLAATALLSSAFLLLARRRFPKTE